MNNACGTLAATLAFGLSTAALADPPADVMNITREADIKFIPSSLVGPSATIRVDASGQPKK